MMHAQMPSKDNSPATFTMMLRILVSAVFAMFLCAGYSCRRAEKRPAGNAVANTTAPGSPSFLLMTLDTWRWDHLGASGSGKVATPTLDRLAQEGVYEPEAETPCPLTTPAHATILTGLLPLRHGILDVISYRLAEGAPTLAEAFRAKGYGTAAFLSSRTLDRRFGLSRGFETYDEGNPGGGGNPGADAPGRDGAETTRAAVEFLRAQPPGAPLFVWIHYYDAHLPYRPRPVQDARYPGKPYAAQVAFMDDEAGKVLSALRADTGRSWRMIVVGDHGEGLFDHHESTHGMALYRSTLHVPLLFFPKPDKPLAHARPWRLEDLSPTVREWCGLGPADGSDGTSLFRTGGEGRLLPSLTLQPSIYYGVNPCLGVRKGSLMYMRHGVEELFDLAADPDEGRDLSTDPSHRKELGELRAACKAAFPSEKLQTAASSTVPEHAADLQNLRALGYLGGFVPGLGSLQRADIRKVCDDQAAFDEAKKSYQQNQNAAAMRRAYEDLLARYPGAALYYKEFGVFLIRRKDNPAAAQAFERAIRLNPGDIMSLANLGGLELEAGRADRARALYEAVLGLDPDDPVAHKNLGIIYAGYLKDPAKAVQHYKKYLEIAPDSDAALVRAYIAAHAP